ncbi:MAG: hypothetical protein RBS21_05510 [Corynebacterium sp.]|nr:hypothetical protein [Corynebacterium sp.]
MSAQMVAVIASPVVSLFGAAVVALITARSTSATTRHQTESTTAVELSRQLFAERAQLLERVDRNIDAVKTQVTNGGSNLAATVGETNRQVSDLGDDMRVLRADLSGLGDEVRGLRHDLNAVKRRVGDDAREP